MCWYSLHSGSRCPGTRIKLVDEQAGELVLPHKRQSLLKVLCKYKKVDLWICIVTMHDANNEDFSLILPRFIQQLIPERGPWMDVITSKC